MLGATLSRWTMAFFAISLVFLLSAMLAMTGGFGFPFAGLRAPQTLIVLHLVVLGWLSLLMIGALLQFVPVLVARPLRGERLVLPALLLLVTGIITLVSGFAVLAGLIAAPLWLLPVAGLLLAGGFALIAVVLGMTIASARPFTLPTRFVMSGLMSLLVTALLGVLFTLSLAGFITSLPLVNVAALGVPLHATLGLGGWISFTAMGVSYRLFTMFLLSADRERRLSHWIWRAGSMALIILACGLIALAVEMASPAMVLLAALLPGLPALALYGYDISIIYRARKRRHMELNTAASIPAFAAILLSLLLALAMLRYGQSEALVSATIYLFTFGWLSGLSLAQIYKIVPFLTWLECYGPVMGQGMVPRIQDIVSESSARPWFYLYHAGMLLATIALLLGQPLWFRIGNMVNLIAILVLIGSFLRARCLANIPPDRRLPKGALRPHLFHAAKPATGRVK